MWLFLRIFPKKSCIIFLLVKIVMYLCGVILKLDISLFKGGYHAKG